MSFGFGFGFPRRLTSGGGLSPSLYLDFVGTGVLPSTVTFSRGTNATLTDSNGRIAWAPHNLLTNSEDFEAAAWTVTGTTVSANQTLAPDGTTTADKLLETATTANHGIFRSATTVAGSAYTLSWYFKAAERGFARAGYTDGGTDYAVRVNLSTGAITLTDAGITGSVSDAGNGWWRLAVTRTVANASVNVFAGINQDATGTSAYAGNTSSGIFIWGAQLNIANAPVNLLTWSEQFDNAAWIGNNRTITSNTTIAPDGTQTADTLTGTGAGAMTLRQDIATTAAPVTISFFVKADTATTCTLGDVNIGGLGVFNLSIGVVVSGANASITSFGNGWYRCAVSYNPIAGFARFSINPGSTFLPTTTTSIFIWGAQLNTGSVALPYVATTSSIYLPPAYNSTTPKNLLGFTQEPENAAWAKSNSYVQQNLLTWSQDFDNAAWGNANTTVTANAGVAPDGTTTADLLFPATTGTFRDKTQQVTASSAVYVASCFLKASGFRWAYFRNFAASNFAAHFDLQNGVLGTVQAGFTATIANAGNGWYRCTLTSATPIANPWHVVGMSDADNSSTATASGSNGILAWGAQLVQGATAGDYTQTTSAAAPTRYLNWDGTLTGRKLVEDATTNLHRISSGGATINFVSGTPYTVFVYAQAAGRQYMNINAASATNARATFDLVNGTVASVLIGTASILAVGGGWYRCAVTGTATATGVNSFYVQLSNTSSSGDVSYTGDGTSGIYVSDFQLSNSASVDPYVYNPQAAAASAAFYGPRFDYNPTGTPVLSGTEMMPASPAWAYVGTGVSAVGQTVTFSAASAGAQAYANLGLTVGQFYSITFTISNYTSGSFYIDLGGGSLGTGVRNANGTYTAIVYVTPNPSMYVVSSGAGGTAQVTISRVQAVTGYTTTANGLLIEEQRTNLLTYSEQFDNAAWGKFEATVSANTATSPDGATNADTLIESTATNVHIAFVAPTLSAGAHTFSVYYKIPSARKIALYHTPTNTGRQFDVSGNQSAGLFNPTSGGATVSPAGNGWYRASITVTVTAGVNEFRFWLVRASDDAINYAGDGTSGVFLYGAQLEAGSFATSYIPTVASQVTRNADSASMLGDNFYTWYNPNQGTLSAEAAIYAGRPLGNPLGITSITDDTPNNRLTIAFTNNAASTLPRFVAGGVSVLSLSGGTVTLNSPSKIAAAYKTGNTASYANGTQVETSSTAFTFSANILRIAGAIPVTDLLCGHIRRIGYYNTRLPDSTLQALTV